MSVKPDRILRFDAALTPKDVETIRELVADAQANALLRDTSEDRERLAEVLYGIDDWPTVEVAIEGYLYDKIDADALADALIAALRGEK